MSVDAQCVFVCVFVCVSVSECLCIRGCEGVEEGRCIYVSECVCFRKRYIFIFKQLTPNRQNKLLKNVLS